MGLNPPTYHLTGDPRAYVRAPPHPSVTSLGLPLLPCSLASLQGLSPSSCSCPGAWTLLPGTFLLLMEAQSSFLTGPTVLACAWLTCSLTASPRGQSLSCLPPAQPERSLLLTYTLGTKGRGPGGGRRGTALEMQVWPSAHVPRRGREMHVLEEWKPRWPSHSVSPLSVPKEGGP